MRFNNNSRIIIRELKVMLLKNVIFFIKVLIVGKNKHKNLKSKKQKQNLQQAN